MTALQQPGANNNSQHPVRSWHGLLQRQESAVLLLLLALAIILSLFTDTFLTRSNLINFARSFSWIAVAAFGQSLVIMTGGIDLSVGAVMALSGLVSAISLHAGFSTTSAILAGLAGGALVGWLNGLLIGRWRLPAVLVTLGMMSVVRGVISGLTGGWPVRDLPGSFLTLGQGNLFPASLSIPIPALVMVVLAALVTLFLDQTVPGQHIQAFSSGERALLVSGVNLAQLKTRVYIFCSGLAAIGGTLMTARVGVAAPTAATGYELDIVAAAVIGGTGLFGNQGSILGVILGAALMQTLRSGLVLLGFPAFWQATAIGTVVLLALIFDYWRNARVTR